MSDISSKNKKIIVLMLLIIIILLSVLVLQDGSSGKRTILMYIDGSNLESDYYIVSADLESINPNAIDFKKTNVLIYTGGTKEWHNYIDSDSNNIYLLTKDGFKLVDTTDKKNMGDSETLTYFLNYAYENYSAKKYDLLYYNHGGAIDGAIYDDYTGDHLSLIEFEKALEDSKFNEKNRIETIIFRTCLNGTLEVANMFSKYANYFVASEEITYGSNRTSVLNFVNNITNKDSGIEVGKKFINAYYQQMKDIGNDKALSTYAIINLKNVNNLLNSFNKYVSGINVNKNYYELAKIRTKMFEYGQSSYDMIDLYNFIELTKDISNVSSNEVINQFKKTIVYNFSNDTNSNGLSIYFPYNGKSSDKAYFLSVYNDLHFMDNYKKLINSFNDYRTTSSVRYSFSINDDKQSNEDETFSVVLTDEQVKNYSNAFVYVFQREEQSDFYNVVSIDNDVQLDGNKLIFKNPKVLSFYDSELNKTYYLRTTYNALKNNLSIRFTLFQNDYVDGSSKVIFDTDSKVGQANYKLENNNIVFSNIIAVDSTNDYNNGILLYKDDYKTLQATYSKYKILDGNGNFLESEDWERSDSVYGFRVATDDFFDNISLSSFAKDNEYYVAFCITDVFSNVYYSNIIKGGV